MTNSDYQTIPYRPEFKLGIAKVLRGLWSDDPAENLSYILNGSMRAIPILRIRWESSFFTMAKSWAIVVTLRNASRFAVKTITFPS